MAKAGSLAVAAGVATGAWGVIVWYYGGFNPNCFGAACSSPDILATLILAFAAVLVVDSLACLVAPRKAFYASAVLGAIVAVLVGYDGLYLGTLANAGVDVELALAAVTVVLSLFAARSGGGVSEQSNPMNLPVFG